MAASRRATGPRGRWLTGALCAAVLASAPHLSAQSDPDELARRHFESGAAYFEEADYGNALQAFEKAYELSNRAEVLLNIATVHERLQALEQAVTVLEKYVALRPDAEGADTVRRRIENLRKRLSEKPATGPADAGAAAVPPPPPAASSAAPPAAPPAREDAPSHVPAYVALSIGGLSAAGAIVTGLLASSEHANLEKDCAPRCSDDDVSTGKTMALTSTILTGVAVVGVGLGAALLFSASAEPPPRSGLTPRVRAAVGPRGGGAEATWRF